jgi:hypothetical protein
MRTGFLGLLLAVAAATTGCGLLPGTVSGPGFLGGSSCSLMPGGACQEQVDRAAARHPDATEMELTCTAPVCDRVGGAGTVVVHLRNGGKVTEAFTYVGDPAPVPVPACTRMAMDVCRQIASSTAADAPPSKSIRAISITCTASSCTRDRGEADVLVQFADGSEFQSNTGWEGASP